MRSTGFRHRLRQILLFTLVVGGMAGLITTAHIYESWGRKTVLEPSGGRYFFTPVEIAVPTFRQGDERWRRDRIGNTRETVGAVGCAVSSAAMVLASYGFDTDPGRLNRFVTERNGYTPQGWLYWEKAAELAAGEVRHAYEDLGSYDLIDANLARGNPVIAKLRLPSMTTHFVVIAGKSGFDYLTRDPGAGGSKGLYPLRELQSRIEGVRFYEKVLKPDA
ncbi:MAG TPA: C39 family peptidase [Chthoniobacteraceae bacterium]|jgi:hypothetical protein|nr:hypothetical protein [Chthoniobacter sp.]HEV7867303.1 C39 family peptidase [Chthoniobacteraceae bacterium]